MKVPAPLESMALQRDRALGRVYQLEDILRRAQYQLALLMACAGEDPWCVLQARELRDILKEVAHDA